MTTRGDFEQAIMKAIGDILDGVYMDDFKIVKSADYSQMYNLIRYAAEGGNVVTVQKIAQILLQLLEKPYEIE